MCVCLYGSVFCFFFLQLWRLHNWSLGVYCVCLCVKVCDLNGMLTAVCRRNKIHWNVASKCWKITYIMFILAHVHDGVTEFTGFWLEDYNCHSLVQHGGSNPLPRTYCVKIIKAKYAVFSTPSHIYICTLIYMFRSTKVRSTYVSSSLP